MSRFFLRDIHSHKMGYVKTPRRRSAAPTPPVMLQITNGMAEPSERSPPASMPPLGSHGNYVNAVPIAFAPPGFHPAPVKTELVVPRGEPMGCSPFLPNMQTMQVINQMSSPSMAPDTGSAETRKRRNDDAALTVVVKRQAMQDLAGSRSCTDQQVGSSYRQPCCSSKLVPFLVHTVAMIAMRLCHLYVYWFVLTKQKQVCQYLGERELREFSFLKMENRMLHEEWG